MVPNAPKPRPNVNAGVADVDADADDGEEEVDRDGNANAVDELVVGCVEGDTGTDAENAFHASDDRA